MLLLSGRSQGLSAVCGGDACHVVRASAVSGFLRGYNRPHSHNTTGRTHIHSPLPFKSHKGQEPIPDALGVRPGTGRVNDSVNTWAVSKTTPLYLTPPSLSMDCVGSIL